MRFILACLISCLMNAYSYADQLTIGTLAYDPPFETASDKKGNFFGFEIDIMNEICNRLQTTCQYKALTFEQLFNATLSRQIDVAMAGISITAERQQTFLFSLPFLASKAGLLTQSSSAIKKIKDINGKRIGVEAGTLFKLLALEKFPNVKVIEYKEQNDLFQALADDSVDVIVLDEASAQYWINNNGGLFKSIGAPIPLGMGYGIMANLSSSTIIKKINKALSDMESDGSYLAIYNRYF